MPKKMTERDLNTMIEQALARSDWHENTELEQNRRAALDSYFGRNRPAFVNGRSNALSMDVADSLEALASEIMPSFEFDEIAMYDPENAQDVEQAALESRIANRYLKANHGRIEIQGAVRNALLLRNGIVHVGIDKRRTTEHERYEALSPLELQAVTAPNAVNQSIKITRFRKNRDDDELSDLNLTRTTEFKQLKIRNVDPANFIVPREFTSIYLEDADLVGERMFISKSELVSMGFSRARIAKLNSTNAEHKTSSLARNRDRSTPIWDSSDESLSRVETFILYMRADWDNDGIAELRKIIYAGGMSSGEILSNVPHPFQPYAAGTPFLLPNRFWGLSIFDKLGATVEPMKTKALRQYEDNLENANFNELTVQDGSVSMGDVRARRPGGVIRADIANAVQPIPVMDTGTSSRAFLAYMDGMRSERVGASLDLQSAQFQIAGESAHGIERQISTKEQLAQLMCATIGETLIAEMFLRIHQTLRHFMPQTTDFPVGPNRFVSATPGDWIARQEVTVLAGMSNGQRTARRNALSENLLQQEKLHAAGFGEILVNAESYHAALIDWTKAGGISAPRRYWLDPREPEQQQAAQAKQQAAQAEQQKKEAFEERIFQTQVLIADRDNAAGLMRHTTQLRFDYFKEILESEVEEFRIQAQGSDTIEPDEKQLEAQQDIGRSRSITP